MNDQLLEILNESVAQGRFYATGKLPMLDLKLEVKDLGSVRTPIAPTRAKQIIKRCRQAPYGLGQKTLVDTSVRNVWELGPRKFKIHSPEWKKQLSSLLEKVAKKLGLEDQKVKAQLYKMLVYEKGSFFVSHQDTEKVEGMFATLIISLPSQHTGGTLVISHIGEEKKISFGGKSSATTIQYASFYADCSHEIKPITSGYRVCLVYNLSLPQKTKTALTLENQNTEEKVTDLLKEWNRDIQQPEKKIILFDHQYTEAELSLKNLKNKDYINGEILYQAAQKAQCEVHLALLAFHESGVPSGGYEDYDYYGRRGYYGRYDDDDDDDDNGDYVDSGGEMEEIFDQDLSVIQWLSPTGQKKEMGFIPISNDEIIANIDFKDREPDESEYEGYMGNYGPSLDRWYHRAALVIWPKQYNHAILVQAGPTASVPDLSALARKMRQSKGQEKASLLQDCRSFASAIIEHGKFESSENNKSITLMLQLIPALEDKALAKDFFQKIFSTSFYGDEGKSLAAFLDAIGWKNLQQELIALFEKETGSAYKMIQLLEGLYKSLTDATQNKSAQSTAEELSILSTLADRLSKNIELWDKNNHGSDYFFYSTGKNESHKQRIEIITSIIERCYPLFTTEALNNLVHYFASAQKYYPLHEVLIPVLEHYGKSADHNIPMNPAIKHLITLILETLQEHTETPIRIPEHWEMEANWECQCKDCSVLKEFLEDAKEKSLRVKMGKERRKHMHRIIDAHVIDLTHNTIRQGSPFTLVFEKNRKSFEEKEKIWQKELKILNKYKSMIA